MTEPKPTLEELAQFLRYQAMDADADREEKFLQCAEALRAASEAREAVLMEAIKRANNAWDLARDHGEDHLEAHHLAMETIVALLPTKPTVEPTKDVEREFDSVADLEACVDAFAKQLKQKLRRKTMEGKDGWDDPNWPRKDIIRQLRQHIKKGDMLDVAAFAMFAWNQEP